VKIARIIDETKIENKERGQAKREIGPGDPNSQGSRNFGRSKSEIKQDKGKQAIQWKPMKPVASVDISTLAHAEALRAHVSNVVKGVTKPLITQGSHGIVGVTLKDPE